MNEIDVILVQPEIEENLGFIARVMKNFGCSKLKIISPKTSITEKNLWIAVHAKEILKNAEIIKLNDDTTVDVLKKLRKNYDLFIGTTAKVSSDYNINRSVLEPKEFFKKYSFKKAGLVIGRESSGLTNDELFACDVLLTIPTSKDYKAMNISHAISIILYENFVNSGYNRVKGSMHSFRALDRDILLSKIKVTVEKLNVDPSRKVILNKIWKRVIGKASITKREGLALMGYFSKIDYQLKTFKYTKKK